MTTARVFAILLSVVERQKLMKLQPTIKERVKTMSEKITTPKTIKLSTVIWSISVVVAIIAGFIGGVVVTNKYNDTVKAQAVDLSSKLQSKNQ